MKNRIITLMLFCIVLCLCSCNELKVGNIITSQIITSQQDKEATTNKGEESKVTRYDLVYDPKIIESYKEYQMILESGNLPNNFVRYEQVSVFGDFGGVVFLSDTYEGQYNFYAYILMDESGFEYTLHIYLDNSLEGTVEDNPTHVVNINENDMRRLNNEESGHYDYNNLIYEYRSGLLESINWEIDGVTYILTGSLSDYPNVTSTPLGKLIDLKNASTVIDSIS